MDQGYFQIKVIKAVGEFACSTSESQTYTVKSYKYTNENSTLGFLVYSKDSKDFSQWEGVLETNNRTFINQCKFSYASRKQIAFSLFYSIVDLVPSMECMWIIGKDCAQVLNHQIAMEFADVSHKSCGDDIMDVDSASNCNKYQSMKKIPKPNSLMVKIGSLCSSTNFIKGGILLCHKSELDKHWCLQAILPTENKIDCDEKSVAFTFEIEAKSCGLEYDDIECLRPSLLCIETNDDTSSMLESRMSKSKMCQLFGLPVSSSFSCVCCVGLPDGRIIWHTFSESNVDRPNFDQQVLFNIGEPVKGIHVSHMFKPQGRNECLLIIGALGKICFISSEAYFNSSTQIKTLASSFWVTTISIPSPLYSPIMINNTLVYISSGGQLWMTVFHAAEKEKLITLDPVSESTEYLGIMSISSPDTEKGVLSLLTYNGNFYICQLVKISKFIEGRVRMPSLMNDCFKLSLQLQQLEYVKALQTRLFTAISTFASLKFSDKTDKESVTCIVTEVCTQPKKYLLDINYNLLEALNLDAELWGLYASVQSYFQTDARAVSKTGPLKNGSCHLCLELQEQDFQSSSTSIFPLSLEAGLILNMPESWKEQENLQLLLKKLPLYLRLQMIIIHDLFLVKNRCVSKYSPTAYENSTSISSVIKKLGETRPMLRSSNSLLKKSRCELPLEFSFSVSSSNALSILNASPDDLANSFLEHILRKCQLRKFSNDMVLSCRNLPISLSASQNQNNVVIRISANSFNVLAGLRLGVIETLLNSKRPKESSCVSIPASMNRKCEDISATILRMFKENRDSTEFRESIIKMYQMLRKDVSNKLPFF